MLRYSYLTGPLLLCVFGCELAEGPPTQSETSAGVTAPDDSPTNCAPPGPPPTTAPELDRATWPSGAQLWLDDEGVYDATNLVLDPSGEFRWIVDGCDFWDSEGGNWEVRPDGIWLTSGQSDPSFFWTNGVTFRQKVTKVVLSLTPGNVVQAVISTEDGDIWQKWRAGHVCPACSQNLLTPHLYTCEYPFDDMWSAFSE